MKKIISLLMVCFLMLSMATIASAAATGSTLSVSQLTATDLVEDADAGDYFMVAVPMDKLYDTATTTLADGYNVLQFDLVYDDTKIVPHEYGSWGSDDGWGWAFKQGPTWKRETLSGQTAIVTEADGKKAVRIVATTSSASKTMLNKYAGDGTLFYFAFSPVDGATGVANITLDGIVFSTANELVHRTADFTIVPGSITLTSAPAEYTVTASAGANGSVNKASIKGVTGTDTDFVFTADEGYVIDTLTVDGVAVPAATDLASYAPVFKIGSADATISATFKAVAVARVLETFEKRYKDENGVIYTFGKAVAGTGEAIITEGEYKYGIATDRIKEPTRIMNYPANQITAKGWFVVGLTGVADDKATWAFADFGNGIEYADTTATGVVE